MGSTKGGQACVTPFTTDTINVINMNKRISKNCTVKIYLTEQMLGELKSRAEEEGLPYRALIASVVHKYVTGRLVDVDSAQAKELLKMK